MTPRGKCKRGVRVPDHCRPRRGMRCILRRGWSIILMEAKVFTVDSRSSRVGMVVTSRIKLVTSRGMVRSRGMGSSNRGMEGRVVIIISNHSSSKGMVEERVEAIIADAE
jgi:hypothetical protein